MTELTQQRKEPLTFEEWAKDKWTPGIPQNKRICYDTAKSAWQAGRSSLESENAELRKENGRLVAEMTAITGGDGFRCGLIHGIAKAFVGGCGEHVSFAESYRCADCTASFHRKCINEHFELDAYVKNLRELNASGAIRDWKEALAKSESENAPLREALRQIADGEFAQNGYTSAQSLARGAIRGGTNV